MCRLFFFLSLLLSNPPPGVCFKPRASGPSMAAGSVMVIMTSLTSSIGMSPITRIRLASSRVSGILRFSPAQPKKKWMGYMTGGTRTRRWRRWRRVAQWQRRTCDGLGSAAVHAAQGGHAAQAFGQRRGARNCRWADHCSGKTVAQRGRNTAKTEDPMEEMIITFHQKIQILTKHRNYFSVCVSIGLLHNEKSNILGNHGHMFL